MQVRSRNQNVAALEQNTVSLALVAVFVAVPIVVMGSAILLHHSESAEVTEIVSESGAPEVDR